MRSTLPFLAFLFVVPYIHAQNTVLRTGSGFFGSGNLNNYLSRGTDVAYAPNGDIYLCSDFFGNIDFDSGGGSAVLTSPDQTFTDMALCKYDSLGQFLWGFSMGTPGSSDLPTALAIHPDGGVVMAGGAFGVFDADPGPGTAMTSPTGTSNNLFVARYQDDMSHLWSFMIGVSGTNLEADDIAVDGVGNTWVCGRYQGTLDLDPSSGLFPITSAGSYDGFVAQYDVAGAFVNGWSISGASTGERVRNLGFNAAGDLVISGTIASSADFDPGPGTAIVAASGLRIFIAQYTTSGTFISVDHFGGTATVLDAQRMVIDAQDNILLCGIVYGATSLDPNSAATQISTGSNRWMWLANYDTNVDQVWFDALPGTSSGGYEMHGIATEPDGDVFVCGDFINNFDADPSNNSQMVFAGGSMFCLKYAALDGALLEVVPVQAFQGGMRQMVADTHGKLALTGSFTSAMSFAGSFITGSGPSIFLISAGECLPPSIVQEPVVASDYCSPAYEVLDVDALGTGLIYSWTVNGSTTGTGSDTLDVGPLMSGNYTYQCIINGLCGSDTTDAVTISVSQTPEPIVIEVAGMLTCTNASGLYQWFVDGVPINGATSATWSPAQNGFYTVQVMDAFCIGTSDPFPVLGMSIGDTPAASAWLVVDRIASQLMIQGRSGAMLELLDFAGQLVHGGRIGSDRWNIAVGHLASGAYFVRCGNDIQRAIW